MAPARARLTHHARPKQRDSLSLITKSVPPICTKCVPLGKSKLVNIVEMGCQNSTSEKHHPAKAEEILGKWEHQSHKIYESEAVKFQEVKEIVEHSPDK